MIQVQLHHVSVEKQAARNNAFPGAPERSRQSRNPNLRVWTPPGGSLLRTPLRPRLTVPGGGSAPPPPPEVASHAASTSCRCPAGRGPSTLGLCPAPRHDPRGRGTPHDQGGRRSLRRWRLRRLHHFPPGSGVGWRWPRRLGSAGQSRRRQAPGSLPGCRRPAWAIRAAVTRAFSGRRAGGAPGPPPPGSWGMA